MKLKDVIIYVSIIVVIVVIRIFIVTPIKVNGPSMNDTLQDGEIMILKKYDKDKLERFDIVVVELEDEKIIKRIIGMPKEDINYKDGQLYINGEAMEDKYGNGTTRDFVDYCAEDEYFVMGDNRGNSYDSRKMGCVKSSQILGKTNFVVFPFSKWGNVK